METLSVPVESDCGFSPDEGDGAQAVAVRIKAKTHGGNAKRIRIGFVDSIPLGLHMVGFASGWLVTDLLRTN